MYPSALRTIQVFFRTEGVSPKDRSCVLQGPLKSPSMTNTCPSSTDEMSSKDQCYFQSVEPKICFKDQSYVLQEPMMICPPLIDKTDDMSSKER